MERFFTCPYCWQEVSILLDPSETQESIIEDCEVCCRPIEFRFRIEAGELLFFEVRKCEGVH